MKEIKLNLGCGSQILSGWINIDNSPSVILSHLPMIRKILFRFGLISTISFEAKWPKGVFHCDILRKLPYLDGSADKIYSSHLLEHLAKDKGEFLLKECYRILKKGGLFRLVVPDLEFHAKRYLRAVSGNEAVGREPHDELLWNMYGAYLEWKRPGASHRYMYDWPTLRLVLQSAGFSRILRQDYKKSIDPEMASLDNHPDDSIHVDLVK